MFYYFVSHAVTHIQEREICVFSTFFVVVAVFFFFFFFLRLKLGQGAED